MDLHENSRIDEVPSLSDYEIERNKPMPSLNHSLVQSNLITEFNMHYRKKYSIASELSLELADWPSVPDLSIISKRTIDFSNDQIKLREAPLCIVEIISPSQSLNELTEKAREYFSHGVKSCWLVLLPLTSICVFSAPADYTFYRAHEILHDPVLDVSLSLKEVFE